MMTNPTPRRKANGSEKLRFIDNHAHIVAKKATQIDWRMMMAELGSLSELKRRRSSRTNGSAVPVAAAMRQKKNNHRGPTVGRVRSMINSNPDQPKTAKMMAARLKV
jgi:hypothetical protein